MSKRAGTGITLKQLIDEVGVNAARYFFISRSLDTQMDFDLELAKKESSENPVFYICYAYARICSILKENSSDQINISYENLNNEEALTKN
jgi:arginyl-tRNA synthetase